MYTDSFWDTVRGNRLADTLIRELPKLNGNQYTVLLDRTPEKVQECINGEILKGNRFVSSVPFDEKLIVVFER